MVAFKWVFSQADPWIAEHGDINRVFLAGDRAGGNITNGMAMELGLIGDSTRQEGVAILCPYYGGLAPIPGEDLFLNAVAKEVWLHLIGPNMKLKLDDLRFNPLADNAPGLSYLVSDRAFVITGGMDPLKWRGDACGEKLKESKGWGDDGNDDGGVCGDGALLLPRLGERGVQGYDEEVGCLHQSTELACDC